MQQTMYDKVGEYNQDQINGFDEAFIYDFIQMCSIKKGEKVLDAMAGDGNLSKKIIQRHPEIDLTTTDICETQCGIAAHRLGEDSKVLALDFTQEQPFENEFDVIVVKSGNHEIPVTKQLALYKNIYKALKPGGRFINLGILLPNDNLRGDLNRLNEYRSNLANVPVDIENRYFLTADEFYGFLTEAGFESVGSGKKFHYTIDMGILSDQYFSGDADKKIIMNGVVTGLHNFRSQNLTELEENWKVKFPGEVTVATKVMNQ